MTLKPKEPFIVESDAVLGMDDRPAVEADFRAILTGHSNFPPGVWLEWNDPKAFASFGTRLEDSMSVEKNQARSIFDFRKRRMLQAALLETDG